MENQPSFGHTIDHMRTCFSQSCWLKNVSLLRFVTTAAQIVQEFKEQRCHQAGQWSVLVVPLVNRNRITYNHLPYILRYISIYMYIPYTHISIYDSDVSPFHEPMTILMRILRDGPRKRDSHWALQWGRRHEYHCSG